MGEDGRPSEPADERTRPGDVQVRTTRRPFPRKRKRRLITMRRVKDLSAPLDMPGAELGEVPVIGPIILLLMFAIFVVVASILIVALLIALVEVLIVAAIAVVGGTWAWLRKHPKVTVLTIDGRPWVRTNGTTPTYTDARAIRTGADPVELGYEPLPRPA